MLPLFWKTRQRLAACVLVLLIFFISLASVLGELVPVRASSPLWHNLQASLVHISNGPLPPFIPPVTSTQTNTDVPTITPTDPPINQPGGYTPTPADSYPTSTSYPPVTSTNPVAKQPSYPVTQPTSRYNNGVTTQPTNPPPATNIPNPTPTQPAGPTPTPTATPVPTRTPSPTDTPTLTPTDTPVPPVSCMTSLPTPTATPTLPVTATPTPPPATAAGTPVLASLEQVTAGAFGQNDEYVPNSWGVQKSRIVRTSTGDIFAVYISEGTGLQDRTWHLMHRTPGADGKWKEVKIHSNNGTISNDAGTEPINILVGPADELHLFIWPGTQGKLVHVYSKDLGQSFDQEEIVGSWSRDQGYSGATIDAKGDMVIYQTAADIPGQFLWSYYSASDKNWTFHTNTLDCRYTYAFFFLGDNGDLTITAMRDVKRQELGLTSSSGFDYIFNAIGYVYIKNVAAPDPQMSSFFNVTEVQPKNNTDSDITYLTDSYVDTAGRVHILYNNMYEGPDELNGLHHAIIENGRLVYDELQKDSNQQPIELGIKVRMTQNAQGHFYLITMDPSGNYLDVYPGTDSDTDGTQLEAAVKLNISRMPGCSNYDFCHSPTFMVPRSGNSRSDVIDGVYGNFTKEIYFQIDLRGQSISK